MGRLVGMAVASRFGADQLVTTSQLVSILGQPVGQLTAAADLQRMPVDQVYESALQTTVQIIATP
jgi:S1-C subfamily serine protease